MDAVRASLAMIHDRPWIGSGLGTWTRMYPRYAGLDKGVTVNQAHNDWAQMGSRRRAAVPPGNDSFRRALM
jgi:O-antigen ligase